MDSLILVDSLNKINESLNEISKNINNLNKDKEYVKLLEEKTQQEEVEIKDLFIKSRIQKIWKLCTKRILNDMDILDIKFNLHQIEQCIEYYEESLNRLSNKEIIGVSDEKES